MPSPTELDPAIASYISIADDLARSAAAAQAREAADVTELLLDVSLSIPDYLAQLREALELFLECDNPEARDFLVDTFEPALRRVHAYLAILLSAPEAREAQVRDLTMLNTLYPRPWVDGLGGDGLLYMDWHLQSLLQGET